MNFERAAECLRILAHPARLELVQILLNGRFPVGSLAEQIGVASHVASEHLKLMERCGLLRGEREGRSVFYVIAEEHLSSIMACIESRFSQPDMLPQE